VVAAKGSPGADESTTPGRLATVGGHHRWIAPWNAEKNKCSITQNALTATICATAFFGPCVQNLWFHIDLIAACHFGEMNLSPQFVMC
jgi:hypothetical protein